MTEKAALLLQEIQKSNRYPVVRFELRSKKDRALRATALNHVHLVDKEETLEMLRERGNLLRELVEEKMIVIDYALPVTVTSDYIGYEECKAFEQLKEAVEEGKSRLGFLFDYAAMKRGIVKLTKQGEKYNAQ